MINLRLLIGKPLKTGSFTERILGANIFSFFAVDTLSSWKHVVWSYDATTSTYAMYINGQNLNLPKAYFQNSKSQNQQLDHTV